MGRAVLAANAAAAVAAAVGGTGMMAKGGASSSIPVRIPVLPVTVPQEGVLGYGPPGGGAETVAAAGMQVCTAAATRARRTRSRALAAMVGRREGHKPFIATRALSRFLETNLKKASNGVFNICYVFDIENMPAHTERGLLSGIF